MSAVRLVDVQWCPQSHQHFLTSGSDLLFYKVEEVSPYEEITQPGKY